jgi:hypothetical protein
MFAVDLTKVLKEAGANSCQSNNPGETDETGYTKGLPTFSVKESGLSVRRSFAFSKRHIYDFNLDKELIVVTPTEHSSG